MNTAAQDIKIKLIIDNKTVLTATMIENSSVTALVEILKDGPLTIEMSDYGNMEKVGTIGTVLPGNDEQITTVPGDIILYQGKALVIYYAPNSWIFTRLGRIDSITRNELKAVLGEGDVNVKLSLLDFETSIGNIYSNEETSGAFPNPVRDYLEIPEPFNSMTLMDANGRIILTSKDKITDVSDLESGIYFVKIETENKEMRINKIIKSNS
jgi:hypothetical protein